MVSVEIKIPTKLSSRKSLYEQLQKLSKRIYLESFKKGFKR